jgi:DNA-directed RNA polymerase specialized sigma24 family protein
VLRYYADCTEADTAHALGISIGAVKSHAHRAITSLGKKLEASR